MRSLERGARHESLDAAISRIALAYGFSTPPVAVSKRAMDASGASTDSLTAAQMAMITETKPTTHATQLWGTAKPKKGTGTTIAFTVLAARSAIAQALVVKTALSVAELAGYTDLQVGVSSVGDGESRRRFTRELGNFFKKNAEQLPPELKAVALHDPEKVYRTLLATTHPLAERLPRPIDYLSENSRKVMTDTLSLFESVGIMYALESHVPAIAGVNSELIFIITGTDAKGERGVIASGGRFDELMKKHGSTAQAVGMSVMVPKSVEPDVIDEQLSCFVVHVGDAAKLKAFSLLEGLWRANLAISQALMAETLREQMDKAKADRAKYIAIVGQREALDGTVLLRNMSTQMQSSMPLDKLVLTLSRAKR